MTEHDVAVLGGGVVGSSIAWGLANARLKVAVLDEGDAPVKAVVRIQHRFGGG